MQDVSERIERLICRHLDGEITADEQLELDKELLRNVAAQEMLQDYAAIDIVSARVLKESAARQGALPMVSPNAPAMRPVRRPLSWMVPVSALAACLALFMIWQTPSLDPSPPRKTPLVVNAGDGNPVRELHPTQPIGVSGSDVGVWHVSDRPAAEVDRVTNRNVIFLADDEGNIYMINVDHVRELQKPRNRSGFQFTRDPI